MRAGPAPEARRAPAQGRVKRSYHPPAILSRDRLEALAVDCSVGGKDNVILCGGLLQS